MSTAPFVRLPRGFESEDWWRAVPLAARCLSVLLIGQASFKREKCRGVWVEPGQLVSTQRELAEASGATRSQVRSAIAALERVGFLKTARATDEKSSPTVFSIVEWRRFIHPSKDYFEGLAAENYQEYLASPHWQRTRARALEAAAEQCEWISSDGRCQSTKNLNVHHLTYENLGAEKPEDLQVLCRRHHEQVHKTEQTGGGQ